MPTITLNKRVFEKLVGKKLPLMKLKNKIAMLGTDLESIKGNEITVEVFPNRPDMLSEQGFARAFSSFIGIKTGLRKYNVENSKEEVVVECSVKAVRPFTACAIVKGLKLKDEQIKEVIKIQEKLHITYGRNRKKAAIGIYPLEKIKPPIRLLAKKPEDIKFVPLDFKKELNGLQILSKHPAGREYGNLLKGLKKFPVFMDSANQILSMPPVINSELTGKITKNTKNIFIECSGFDFSTLNKCLNIIVTALADMNGKIYSMKLKYGKKIFTTPDLTPEKMNIDINYINKILGLNLKEAELKKFVEQMGYGYKNKKVLVPAYRADVLHQIDIIEDIAIAYGYENLKEEIPTISTIAQENKFEIFKRKVAEILAGIGLTEAVTYNITNKESQQKKMGCDIPVIELENALSSEYNALRAWTIPSLLEVLQNNKHHDYPQNIFGFGDVFKKGFSETGIVEATRVAVLLSNNEADYTKIKQIFDYLMRMLDTRYKMSESEHPSFIQGRVARVYVRDEAIAYIGEIHPKILTSWELRVPTACFELNLTDLYNYFFAKKQ